MGEGVSLAAAIIVIERITKNFHFDGQIDLSRLLQLLLGQSWLILRFHCLNCDRSRMIGCSIWRQF